MAETKKKLDLRMVMKNKKMPFIAGGVFLLILVLIFLVMQFAKDNSTETNSRSSAVVFVIDGKEYYKDEILKIAQYPMERISQSEESTVQEIFQLQKKIVNAEKLGVNPSEADINDEMSQVLTDDIKKSEGYKDEYRAWFDLVARANAVDRYVNQQYAPGYEGYALVFYFGQRIDYGDDYKPEGLNDPALIAQDKAYAKDKAEYYHAQVKDGKMSAAEVSDVIKADPKLANQFYTVENPFKSSQEGDWTQKIGYSDVVDAVVSQETTGVSELKIGGGYVGGNFADETQKKEMFYYFTALEKVPSTKVVSQADFDTSLVSLNSEFKYIRDYEVNVQPGEDVDINSLAKPEAEQPQQSGVQNTEGAQ